MRLFVAVVCTTLVLFANTSSADDAFQPTPPQEEHEWLQQFAGEWTSTSEATAGPGQPAFECTGTITSRMLGEYWVVNEMSTNIAGMQMRGLQTIGYDPEKQKYVGTWVDSMMNHMWQYEGDVDESGKKLDLYAEGPNFAGGEGMAMYRDSYEFVSEDEMIITSAMQGPDGEWVTFMTGEAHRTAAAAEAQ